MALVGTALLCIVASATAEKPAVCFTAHGKTWLQCTRPVEDGSSISVYDDAAGSPQRAR
jgi:hypothetical protein